MTSGEFDTIRYCVDDGIATITLDRAGSMNAFKRTMAIELIAALDETDCDKTDRDDAVRAVIVTGNGERAFCVGADLKESVASFLERRAPAFADRVSAGLPVMGSGTEPPVFLTEGTAFD